MAAGVTAWYGPCLEPGEGHRVDIPGGVNVRDLGGYQTPDGETACGRFLRSGNNDSLGPRGMAAYDQLGVRTVIDLRGRHEVRADPDPLACRPGVRYLHAALYSRDLSDPVLRPDDVREFSYGLTAGYLLMLSNKPRIREIFSFIADGPADACVLFHCAAGMDRTGIIALLLLGLAGVDRSHIIADYCYSFAPQAEVDAHVFGEGQTSRAMRIYGAKTIMAQADSQVPFIRLLCSLARMLRRGLRLLGRAAGNTRIHADDRDRAEELEMRAGIIATCYDRIVSGYGGFEAYLLSCGLTRDELARIRVLLLG